MPDTPNVKMERAIHEYTGRFMKLYRGVRARNVWFTEMNEGFSQSPNHLNDQDFGHGFYATDSFELACEYAGPRGYVMVFDWTERAVGLNCLSLIRDLDRWTTVINHFLTPRNKPKINIIDIDMIIGPITANHTDIITKRHEPEALNAKLQYVGKREKALDLFADRYLGVVFMEPMKRVTRGSLIQ